MSSLDEAAVTDEQPARDADLLVARTRGPWLEIVGLLALPLVLYILLEVEPFFVQNGVDPFIYVGYIENHADLIDRFGYTYFAVRFGLILPAQAAGLLFGPIAGHFVLRYVLALVAAVPVYLLGRRHGSKAAGLCGAILCLSSPVFLRALMTTYADTTGLPCLLGGFACLMMPAAGRRGWSVLAGVLFGVAIHSNPFLIGVIVVGCGARLALQLIRGEWRAYVDYVWAVASVIAVTLVGAAYYWVRFGDPNIIGPSLDALRTYSGQMAKVFRAPTHDWLAFSIHLYAPLVLAVAMILLLITRPRSGGGWARALLKSPLADCLAMLVAVQSFYLVQQFVLDGYALEVYYYASYLFAFVVLGVVACVVEIASRSRSKEMTAWIAVAVVLALPLLRNVAFPGIQLWAWPAVPIMLVAVTVAVVVGSWRRLAAPLVAVVLLGALVLLGIAPPRDVPRSEGQAFRFDPNYQLALGNGSLTGLDWYSLAGQLIDATPSWDQDPGSVIFWYRNEPGVINAIQSTYLWRGSTIQALNPGLPELFDAQERLLLERTPRYIMLLAVDPADLALGQSRLEAIGLQPESIEQRTLSAGTTKVYSELLRLPASACDQEWREPVAWLGLPVCSP